MTLEEFENASEQELRQRANDCFARSVNAGTGDKPYLYLEAQFYINEIQRRQHEGERGEDTRIANRDFWLDVFIIVLILAEIGIGIWGIVISIREGREQAQLIKTQTDILGNLRASTESTAKALKEQLDIQYRVFLNPLYDGAGRIQVINNSKTEVSLWGVKLGTKTPLMRRGGPLTIAEHTEGAIPLLDYDSKLFDKVPKTSPVAFPLEFYLKNAINEEYVWKGQLTLERQNGGGVTGSVGNSTLNPETWSRTVKISAIP